MSSSAIVEVCLRPESTAQPDAVRPVLDMPLVAAHELAPVECEQAGLLLGEAGEPQRCYVFLVSLAPWSLTIARLARVRAAPVAEAG